MAKKILTSFMDGPFYEIFKNGNVQGLRSKFIKVVVDPLFFGPKNYKGLLFYESNKIWKNVNFDDTNF